MLIQKKNANVSIYVGLKAQTKLTVVQILSEKSMESRKEIVQHYFH